MHQFKKIKTEFLFYVTDLLARSASTGRRSWLHLEYSLKKTKSLVLSEGDVGVIVKGKYFWSVVYGKTTNVSKIMLKQKSKAYITNRMGDIRV